MRTVYYVLCNGLTVATCAVESLLVFPGPLGLMEALTRLGEGEWWGGRKHGSGSNDVLTVHLKPKASASDETLEGGEIIQGEVWGLGLVEVVVVTSPEGWGSGWGVFTVG